MGKSIDSGVVTGGRQVSFFEADIFIFFSFFWNFLKPVLETFDHDFSDQISNLANIPTKTTVLVIFKLFLKILGIIILPSESISHSLAQTD